MNRRRFLGSLLAGTALAASAVPAAKVVMGWDLARGEDTAQAVWFLMGGEEPQLIKWSGVENPGEWTTSDIVRYQIRNVPAHQMGGWNRI